MRAARPSVVDRDGGRKADLAAIHIGKKALGWDDAQYRDLLWTVCQVRSSADLDFTGRKRFLAHLQACGWAQHVPAAAKRPKTPWTPKQRLIWSLWQQLADASLVSSRSRTALDVWVKRQTQVDRLEWLNPHQVELVIHSLKGWLARRGEPA